MAITLIQHGRNGSGGGTSVSFTMPATPRQGSVIVLGVGSGTTPSALPTDNQGGTFTLQQGSTGSVAGMRAAVYTLLVGPVVGTYTITVTWSPATYSMLCVAEVYGFAGGVVDVAVNNGTSASGPSDGSTPLGAGPLTTTIAGAEFTQLFDSASTAGSLIASQSPFVDVEIETDGSVYGGTGLAMRPASGGEGLNPPGPYESFWVLQNTVTFVASTMNVLSALGQIPPWLVGAGTAAFTATNAATIAPGLPTGWAADDIHILVAHRSDNTAMTALTGWTQLAALSGNNTAGQRVETWWRRAVGGDTAPTVTFGSSTVVRGARIYGVRGCPSSGDPFGPCTFLATASSSTIVWTDITSTGANRLILAVGAFEDDPTTITTMTNYTQTTDAVQASALGNDMMLCHETRTMSNTGAAGAGTVTVSGGTFTASPSVGVLLSLRAAGDLAPPFALRVVRLPA